jgi:ABC-type sugar transport system permease subunit
MAATANPAELHSLARQPLFAWALVFPSVVGLGLFQFFPLGEAVVDSFRTFNPFDQSAVGWGGWDNYRAVFADPVFQTAIANTVVYVLLTLALTIPLSLALAMLIDSNSPTATWARCAIIGALAASETVTASIWNQMYEPSTGLFNGLLNAVGLPTQTFLSGDNQALISIVVMSVWKDIGLPVLIFLAGLQGIPNELRDAASLDGAGGWNVFRRIILPQLRPSLVVAIFMTTINATRIFTPIILLTQGGPNGTTANLTYYAYSQSFEFTSPGTASSAVVILLLLLIVLTGSQARLIRPPKWA